MEPNWSAAANGIMGLTGACLLLELCQGHTAGTILMRTGMVLAAIGLALVLLLVAVKMLSRNQARPADPKPPADGTHSDSRPKQENLGGKAR